MLVTGPLTALLALMLVFTIASPAPPSALESTDLVVRDDLAEKDIAKRTFHLTCRNCSIVP